MAKASELRSVIKSDFRTRYKEHGGTCGDDLANQISAFIKGQDGKPDHARLQQLAEANGCWQATYAGLNFGMRRMNIANRMRALVRKGHVIVWPEPPKKRGRPRKNV